MDQGTLSDMLDPAELAPDAPRLITRAQFEKLVQTDFFDEDERVELIRGVLVTPPFPSPRHDAHVQRLTRLLVLAVGTRAWVRVNAGFAADDYSEVLPDLAIIPEGNHDVEVPTAAWLVVEVALSSLRKDRKIKAPLYAENGVPEYWIVNVDEAVIEVHTDPQGGRYASSRAVPRGERIRLVTLPDVEIAVDEVLGARG